MDDAAWRVRIRFASMDDEERFLEWWEATTHARSYADTPSGEGPLTFFYFADEAPARTLARAIRAEVARLPIDSPQVAVDRWVQDEARWSDESRVSESDDSDDADEMRAARDEYRWNSREWAAKDASRRKAEADDPGTGGSNWIEGVIDALIRAPWP